MAVEGDAGKRDLNLARPHAASGASTSLTPQLAAVLSCMAASTSNSKVVVRSARLSSEFTLDGAQQPV